MAKQYTSKPRIMTVEEYPGPVFKVKVSGEVGDLDATNDYDKGPYTFHDNSDDNPTLVPTGTMTLNDLRTLRDAALAAKSGM